MGRSARQRSDRVGHVPHRYAVRYALAVSTERTEPAASEATTKREGRTSSVLFRLTLDPATGFGIFVPGLFVMALGGAMTWHWIFNIGSGIMLAGMTYVVVAIMLTALQQWAQRRRPDTIDAAAAS